MGNNAAGDFWEPSEFEVFYSAEDAWFWCCRCRCGNRLRFRRNNNVKAKVCETNDIYIILRRLQLTGHLKSRHIRTLVRYGVEQAPPHPRFGASAMQCRNWAEGMLLLGKELKKRGIIK